jgi:hypothetical protein
MEIFVYTKMGSIDSFMSSLSENVAAFCVPHCERLDLVVMQSFTLGGKSKYRFSFFHSDSQMWRL